MKLIQSDSLENYVGQHRADFDPHEPRPELWAALENELHPATELPALRVVPKLAGERPALIFAPAAPRRAGGWQRYGLAAGLAALMLAAGAGEAWKSRRAAPAGVAAGEERPAGAQPEAARYQSPATTRLTASTQAADARLDTAVHGMERYYLGQLRSRQTQLSQLVPGATADWARELGGLDSSYQQLKQELPRHPQPEVVLTAMNRNLQIRLDILDQQLALHGAEQPGLAGSSNGSGGEYALADSRRSKGQLPADSGH